MPPRPHNICCFPALYLSWPHLSTLWTSSNVPQPQSLLICLLFPELVRHVPIFMFTVLSALFLKYWRGLQIPFLNLYWNITTSEAYFIYFSPNYSASSNIVYSLLINFWCIYFIPHIGRPREFLTVLFTTVSLETKQFLTHISFSINIVWMNKSVKKLIHI